MPNVPEIYPMAMFPMLSVRDVAASLDWYTEKVGFTSIFCLPGPGGGIAMAHIRWLKNADLLLTPDADPPAAARPKGVGVAISFLVCDTSVDTLAANLTARGVNVAEGPTNRRWNTREIVVHDPDGFRLVFFEPLDTAKSFADVMKEIAQN